MSWYSKAVKKRDKTMGRGALHAKKPAAVVVEEEPEAVRNYGSYQYATPQIDALWGRNFSTGAAYGQAPNQRRRPKLPPVIPRG